ncbi:MAG: hypothetical protein ACKO23_06715 [Gemmataceae bacterium]
MMFLKRVVPLFPLLLAGILSGCERDEIRTYTVERTGENPETGNVRLLAAMTVSGGDTWFFKLVGRKDIVEMVEPAFQSLVDSLQETEKDGKTLTWKVPTNWKEDRDNRARVATLRPEGVGQPEIAISKLPAAAAVLKPNLDRWRRNDLGLGPIRSRAIAQVSRDKQVGPLKVTLVDMRGPGVSKATPSPMQGTGMPSGKAGPPPTPKASPLKYKLPPGWQESQGGSAIVAASFTVEDNGKSARVLVTPLSGSMPGGLLANVNRWRQEVELPPLANDQELAKQDIRKIRVDGQESSYLYLPGKANGSLVAWLERDGTTWFFKLRGPREVVEKQKSPFESFLQSLTFSSPR